MEHKVTLLMSEFVTHDVKRFVVTRPDGLDYRPGQGVELAVDEPGWRDKGRPFTPTSLPGDGVLEFTIKRYPDHQGVTDKLHMLTAGAPLLMSAPFGAIHYQGRGTFIAAGAGITPFLAILRELAATDKLAGHRLIFSNKTPADVICGEELVGYLGDRCLLLCTRESDCHCGSARVDKEFLQRQIGDFGQHFYVCGPPPFVRAVNAALTELGATPSALVFEK